MNFGDIARKRLSFLGILLAALALSAAPQGALAQATGELDAQAENVADPAVPEPATAEPTVTEAAPGADAYTPLGPEWIKGRPTAPSEDMLASISFQEQYSDDGQFALWMHDAILIPMITVTSLLVLGLLLWVIARFNRRRNPVPSKTSHNTLIEIIWTVVPVLILVIIAVPSITLLSRQYKSAPEDALTVKVTGYQWYWGYSYPDNGGFEVISNMLDDEAALSRGEPAQLAVDNRMVVPVGVPIRIQTTGADVIHSFAVPSLWFKIDSVPGRINERVMTINEPGIYYGQCSELCGARHAYMPIAIEAVPMARFNAWLRSQGGTPKGEGAPQGAAPALAPQEPESAVEGAPGAGEAPEAGTPEVTPAAGNPA
ncbi:cytochrome c oxidase subunit II [Altererythrobacter soli]|uniref:Cytochrome c oxidase subunit 2 n=2 Tax=Croceibacterium soli TaxID=1739690 RepID=A0A6I4UUI2_9SPHN|nr:cytochrome c oxidase subunit II [Croceibacterium soli]